MTSLNLKKWTTVLTLCAVTFAAGTTGVAPALAADTAIVGEAVTPNLEAAAQAMAAATQKLNNGSTQTPVVDNNSSAQKPSNGDTESVGVDYVSLSNPATTIDGQTYLPLRATLEAMKDQALQVEWKADGQQKLKLFNSSVSYEVYLTADGSGLQIQQGGTTYAVKNVGDVIYVPLSFFQAIIPNNTISLSGTNIIVLTAKDGATVWTSNFWGNMNSYQAPVVETPTVESPTVETPSVSTPDVTYPDVNTPSTDNSNSNSTTQTPSVDQGTVDEIVNGISDGTARAIIASAMKYLGVPYVWGGTSPSGFDCSGLVQYVFAENGISLPRTTYEQQAVVAPVSLVALQPGDLVFWGGSAYHVGIYIGDGMYIHAPAPGQSVCIQSYDAYPYTSGGRVLV